MELADFQYGGVHYMGYTNKHGTLVGLEISQKNANCDGICLKKFALALAKQLESDALSQPRGENVFYNCSGFDYDAYGEKMAIIGHIVEQENGEIVDMFKYWLDPRTLQFYLKSGDTMGFSLFKEIAMKRIGFLYKHHADAKVALDWNMRTMAIAYAAICEEYGVNDDKERLQVYRISLVGEKWLICVKSKTGTKDLAF